ncbi:hypothetical protein DFH08DRAFT_799609 [Mycena albidolilacea]|uniref:Uncharacterized protein n=1 Tax=Mycena albidolilacea TaxID=1033008 RepID=A0AAD7ALZ1_9AGAR|nr:hypothetical protein DFH08DRAFT_799609 [Mycena albidolilacea]
MKPMHVNFGLALLLCVFDVVSATCRIQLLHYWGQILDVRETWDHPGLTARPSAYPVAILALSRKRNNSLHLIQQARRILLKLNRPADSTQTQFALSIVGKKKFRQAELNAERAAKGDASSRAQRSDKGKKRGPRKEKSSTVAGKKSKVVEDSDNDNTDGEDDGDENSSDEEGVVHATPRRIPHPFNPNATSAPAPIPNLNTDPAPARIPNQNTDPAPTPVPNQNTDPTPIPNQNTDPAPAPWPLMLGVQGSFPGDWAGTIGMNDGFDPFGGLGFPDEGIHRGMEEYSSGSAGMDMSMYNGTLLWPILNMPAASPSTAEKRGCDKGEEDDDADQPAPQRHRHQKVAPRKVHSDKGKKRGLVRETAAADSSSDDIDGATIPIPTNTIHTIHRQTINYKIIIT